MVDQLGPLKSDSFGDVDYYRQIIYKRAEELLVGKEVVEIQRIPNLDYKLFLPNYDTITAQKVAEFSRADPRMGDWNELSGSMEKYQTHIIVSHEAKARAIEEAQIKFAIEGAARGLAKAKDNEIMSSLESAAGGSAAATATWDDTANRDIGKDVADALEYILDNSNVLMADYQRVAVVIPKKAHPHVVTSWYNNTDKTMEDLLKAKIGLRFLPSDYLSTDALVVVPSVETAIHFEYNGRDIPLTEEEDVPGLGKRYLVTQYYKTVIPDGSSTDRIFKITDVIA